MNECFYREWMDGWTICTNSLGCSEHITLVSTRARRARGSVSPPQSIFPVFQASEQQESNLFTITAAKHVCLTAFIKQHRGILVELFNWLT